MHLHPSFFMIKHFQNFDWPCHNRTAFIWDYKIWGFGYFLRIQPLKTSDLCMMVEGNGRHHLGMMSYLGKILIWGLRESKCQNGSFGTIFWNQSLKVSDNLHNCRRQQGLPFEYDAISLKYFGPWAFPDRVLINCPCPLVCLVFYWSICQSLNISETAH